MDVSKPGTRGFIYRDRQVLSWVTREERPTNTYNLLGNIGVRVSEPVMMRVHGRAEIKHTNGKNITG